MKSLLASLLLAVFVPTIALASPESDRIAALEARLAALEAASRPAPQPAPRVSPRYVNAAKALLGYRMAAFGSPLLGYGGPYGGGGGGGAVSSSQMPDPYTPPDGTWNITGDLATSGDVTVTGGDIIDDILTMRNAGSTQKIGWDSLGQNNFVSSQGNSATARQHNFNGAALTSAGAKLVVYYNNSVEKRALMLDGADAPVPAALGISGAHTALPVGAIVEITCTGAQNWTPTETNATNGEIHTIVNVGASNCTLVNTAGQVLLNGGANVVLGTNDAATLYYSTALSAWVQIGATSNN